MKEELRYRAVKFLIPELAKEPNENMERPGIMLSTYAAAIAIGIILKAAEK